MLNELKDKVLKANLDLVKHNLVIFTWGNASEIDRKTGYIVIKPSGVSYESMKASDMVVVDLKGNVIEGSLQPSSDTPTHIEIYKNHPEIGGIVHTHSTYATSFAQANRPIRHYGTTHADHFYGNIPCTKKLSDSEIANEYELNTGKVINATIKQDALQIPACLVSEHGPFTFGKDAKEAVYNAAVLEQVAKMAFIRETLYMNEGKNSGLPDKTSQSLMDRHYYRKHGKNAYYGQKKEKK